jgi:hypothetical protein
MAIGIFPSRWAQDRQDVPCRAGSNARVDPHLTCNHGRALYGDEHSALRIANDQLVQNDWA